MTSKKVFAALIITTLLSTIIAAQIAKAASNENTAHTDLISCIHPSGDEESAICTAIRDKLVEDGLFFVGVDVIGDKMVEINCLSPGGIPRINRLNKVRLEKSVIDFVEQKVAEMKGDG